MGKTKCCKKKSSCINFDNSTSSSSSISKSYCCPKYPKCHCVVDNCAPIYY